MKKPVAGPARYPLTATETLNFQSIPAWLTGVAEEFIRRDFQIYLAGGAVRDLLWGKLPNDWDLTTDALPEQIEALFPKTVPTGKPFGTITVWAGEDTAEATPNAMEVAANAVQVTTFRSDLGYSDGRRPDAVQFEHNIIPDLARRDFTINAMAYDFSSKLLVDPFGGRKDAYRGILKAVGDPNLRFSEDGLRMFRFYRFLATHNLQPHPATAKAIDPQWAKNLSMERIRDEFSKLLMGEKVQLGLTGLQQSGLLDFFLPELAECRQMDQDYRHSPPLWEHILITTQAIAPQLHLRLAALLHDIAKPKTRIYDETGIHFYGHDELGAAFSERILERLRYPAKFITTVSNLIRWHMFSIPHEAGDGAIRRFIAKAGPNAIPDLLELRRADIVATGRINERTFQAWRDLQDRFNQLLPDQSGNHPPKLAVNGHELMAQFALKPGPSLGKLLDYLGELILDDPALNQKEILLAKTKEYLERELPGFNKL
jgi:poly(A) polymerase/tRNA nucleotidyltransferase (CCA-adding enzyme)